MSTLVRAEWTKLFTTRVWIGLVLGACLMAGGFAALFTGLEDLYFRLTAGQEQFAAGTADGATAVTTEGALR